MRAYIRKNPVCVYTRVLHMGGRSCDIMILCIYFNLQQHPTLDKGVLKERGPFEASGSHTIFSHESLTWEVEASKNCHLKTILLGDCCRYPQQIVCFAQFDKKLQAGVPRCFKNCNWRLQKVALFQENRLNYNVDWVINKALHCSKKTTARIMADSDFDWNDSLSCCSVISVMVCRDIVPSWGGNEVKFMGFPFPFFEITESFRGW